MFRRYSKLRSEAFIRQTYENVPEIKITWRKIQLRKKKCRQATG